jgi:hypothetical protein
LDGFRGGDGGGIGFFDTGLGGVIRFFGDGFHATGSGFDGFAGFFDGGLGIFGGLIARDQSEGGGGENCEGGFYFHMKSQTEFLPFGRQPLSAPSSVYSVSALSLIGKWTAAIGRVGK